MGDPVQLGEVCVDIGEAAGDVDADVGSEHEDDAEFPFPRVDTAVGDGPVEVGVEVEEVPVRKVVAGQSIPGKRVVSGEPRRKVSLMRAARSR